MPQVPSHLDRLVWALVARKANHQGLSVRHWQGLQGGEELQERKVHHKMGHLSGLKRQRTYRNTRVSLLSMTWRGPVVSQAALGGCAPPPRGGHQVTSALLNLMGTLEPPCPSLSQLANLCWPTQCHQ